MELRQIVDGYILKLDNFLAYFLKLTSRESLSLYNMR